MNAAKQKVVTAVPPAAAKLPPREVQQLWFAVARKEWNALVVLPASSGFSTLELAQALAEVGSVHRGQDIDVIDLRAVALSSVAPHIVRMAERVAQHERVIVVADDVQTSQTAIPAVMAADAVLLAVLMGDTEFTSARETIATVGREKIIGAVAVRVEGR